MSGVQWPGSHKPALGVHDPKGIPVWVLGLGVPWDLGKHLESYYGNRGRWVGILGAHEAQREIQPSKPLSPVPMAM